MGVGGGMQSTSQSANSNSESIGANTLKVNSFANSVADSFTSSFGQQQATNQSQSANDALSGSTTRQNVFEPQAQALGGLYGDASGIASQLNSNAIEAGQAAAAPALAAATGADQALAGFDAQGQIDAQADSLQNRLGQLYSQEINPAIEGKAIASGGLGGGRQGVAQGVAAGQLADTFANQYGNIVQGANQTALQAAQARGQNASNIFDMGIAGRDAALRPSQQLAGILGGPTTLTQGDSFSEATGRSSSAGQSTGTTQSQGGSSSVSESGSRTRGKSKNKSKSVSRSKGKSKALNFSIG